MKTPRTDSHIRSNPGNGREYVRADFARRLEQELQVLKWHVDYGKVDGMARATMYWEIGIWDIAPANLDEAIDNELERQLDSEEPGCPNCGCKFFRWWVKPLIWCDPPARYSSAVKGREYDQAKHPGAVCHQCSSAWPRKEEA